MQLFVVICHLWAIGIHKRVYLYKQMPNITHVGFLHHTYQSCIRVTMAREGFEVEFKLCVVNGIGEIVRWEEIDGNRCFAPKGSLLVKFADSDGDMRFFNVRKPSDHYQVLSDWRNQKEIMDVWKCQTSSIQEDESKESDFLLSQFTLQLTKAVITQKEEYFLGEQSQFQQSSQLDFGTYSHHCHHTHYIVTGNQPANWINTQKNIDRICEINIDYISKLEILEKEEISVFHLFIEAQSITDIAQEVSCHWKKIQDRSMKGLIIAYLESTLNAGQIERLIQAGVSVFIVGSIDCINLILQVAKYHKFAVLSNIHGIFIARRQGEQIKIILRTFKIESILSNLMKQLQNMEQQLKGFYFDYDSRQFDRQLQQRTSMERVRNRQILLILHIEHLQQVDQKITQELLKVSHSQNKVIVFVITNQRMPHHLLHRFPVSKHNIIFLNTLGEAYGSSGQIIDLYFYLEINRSTFESNQNIILEQLGTGINKYYRRNGTLVIEFPHNTLGNILKKRALQLVRDVNNKSIAKLIPHQGDYSLQLIPFCLHPSFLYQAIFATYALMVKQQGLVIAIDGTDKNVMRYIDLSKVEGNMKFLSFYLHGSKQFRPNYSCNPLSEHQLQRMLYILAFKQEDRGKGNKYHKGEVLTQIKNLN